MNTRKHIKHTRLALEVLRESESLQVRMAVSSRSGSSTHVFVGFELKAFFRSTRRRLVIQLGILYLKMVCAKLSEATLAVSRDLWLKTTNSVKSWVR